MAEYEILDHTADTGVEVTTGTLEDLISGLATGMFGLVAMLEPCPSLRSVQIEVSAENHQDLVFEALSELIYQSEIEDLVFCDFEVTTVGEMTVVISAGGVPVGEVEPSGPPIKAVTYHELKVTELEDGSWYGRVYFDV